MKIIYIHHGNRKKCNPSTQNDDLTEIGYKDCELTAELFNNDKIKKSIKAIYTSPFFRCKKTAEIVNTYVNAPIICEDRLNEYKSMGEESWVECQNRIIEFIDEGYVGLLSFGNEGGQCLTQGGEPQAVVQQFGKADAQLLLLVGGHLV